MKATYLIEPKFKKSTFSNEYWTNEVNGKSVTIMVSIMWRWGEFSITLTEDQKKKIENSDELLLSDYNYEFISTDDGCERFIEIQNEDSFSKQELEKIYETMYEDVDEEIYDESFMEENGWDLSDTTYEINGGIDFKKIE